MAWHEDKIAIIDSLLGEIEPISYPKNTSNYILSRGMIQNLRESKDLINKAQEHEGRLEGLEAAELRVPVKIWEGNWSSGTLIPNTDGGHVVDTGNLADYNILVFLVRPDDTGERNIGWMPQSLYSFFSSSSDVFKINVGDKYISFYFSDAETLVFDARDKGELLQIWGIK